MEKEEFNRLFGEFVKHKRTASGLTLKELALRVGSEFQNIHRLEQGNINPSVHWISTLAEGFEMKLGDFMQEFDMFSSKKLREPSTTKH